MSVVFFDRCSLVTKVEGPGASVSNLGLLQSQVKLSCSSQVFPLSPVPDYACDLQLLKRKMDETDPGKNQRFLFDIWWNVSRTSDVTFYEANIRYGVNP